MVISLRAKRVLSDPEQRAGPPGNWTSARGCCPRTSCSWDALLAHMELDAIIAHKKRRDVGELMVLLDKVQWSGWIAQSLE